ncbi:MAG: peptidoglycan-binding protein [Syntrophomonas sp.]|nr:peptidoglycan-binding protein [Syntrophomonas sp.]
MVRASRFPLILITLLFVIVFSVGLAQAQEAESLSKPGSIERVDRTDFPALYLATPQLQGDAVWMVQALLRDMGYEIEPDGVFSQSTSEVIRLFQVANNLAVDGRVTQEVWERLINDEPEAPCLTQPEGEAKISIEIDVVKHSLIVFSDGQQIKKFPVAVGKSSTPSPLGEWKIVQKSYSWGNGFGTRWMRLSVPWGIYGIHGTNQPGSIGYSASHGCIRMRNKDVEALYPLIPMGTPVRIVENGQIFPRNFKVRNLQRKAYGQDVVYLQSRLKEKGIIFDNADGRYGVMTELAVKYYQKWHGLNPTGKADAETYRSLGMIK